MKGEKDLKCFRRKKLCFLKLEKTWEDTVGVREGSRRKD